MTNLFITAQNVKRNTGGLERATMQFGSYLSDDVPSTFLTVKELVLNPFLIKSARGIMLVGHRSFGLCGAAIFLTLLRQRFYWCPFWHDYSLEGKRSVLYRIYDLVFMKCLSFSARHFVVSSYEAKKTFCVPSQSLITLPMSKHFEALKVGDLVESTRGNDLLFVGRDVPHKRRWLIPELASQLKLSMAEVIPGEENVDDHKLLEFYVNSKVVVIPSLYESYSLVAIEALACGCLVVAGPNVMVGERFKDYDRYITVASNRKEDFSLAIAQALRDWRPAMADQRMAFFDQFTTAHCKDEFIASYYDKGC